MKNNISDLFEYIFVENFLQKTINESILFIESLPLHWMIEDNKIDILSFDYKLKQQAKNSVISVIQEIPNQKKYDLIFYPFSKNKKEAIAMLHLLKTHLAEGGHLVTAAMNDAGGKSLVKIVNNVGYVGESHSKNKARIFIGKSDSKKSEDFAAFTALLEPHQININGHDYFSQAGIFGWNKIDVGSKLLIDHISEPLKGVGADFGCGYGYLSKQICAQYPDITDLYCIDVDWRALECSKLNLKSHQDQANVEFLWADLSNSIERIKPLDFVVMNPPFHEGKETKVDLGHKMIECAHSRLKNGGKLYIVANKQLPYERLLTGLFKKQEKLFEGNGFKVFKATK